MAQVSRKPQRTPHEHPMVSFEHYMLADDRPTHSMAVQMRFWFSGVFDRKAFLSALTATLDRHPIFQMHALGNASHRTSSIKWVKSENKKAPFICWKALGHSISHPENPFHIDLSQEVGLRLWIRDNADQLSAEHPPTTEILTQFHHSVCDGIGMLQFMEDLMIHYGLALGISVPPPRPIDDELFAKRGDFWLSKPQWQRRTFKDFKRAFNFFKALAQPLAIPRNQQGSTTNVADLFASERRELSETTLKNIRAVSREAQATVNDLLLYELFKTLSSWNYRLGKYLLKIRIALAVSLRTEDDNRQSSMNIVSMVFLDKSHHQVRRDDLLKSIVDETVDVKTNRMGITLPRVMRFFGRIPYAILIFMRLPLCSATAVLTNLGSTLSRSRLIGNDGKLRIGNIVLERYELLPPVRPKTSASFAINYYAGKLNVTLRYDSTRLTQHSANHLLDEFSKRLEKVAPQAGGRN
jgi:hypothetical protein